MGNVNNEIHFKTKWLDYYFHERERGRLVDGAIYSTVTSNEGPCPYSQDQYRIYLKDIFSSVRIQDYRDEKTNFDDVLESQHTRPEPTHTRSLIEWTHQNQIGDVGIVTLDVNDWNTGTKTVTIDTDYEIKKTTIVYASPIKQDSEECENNGVYCFSSADNGVLTFRCETIPSRNLTMLIMFGAESQNYPVSIVVTSEHGDALGSGEYNIGDTVNISWDPYNDRWYKLVKWSNGRTDREISLTVNQSEYIEAITEKLSLCFMHARYDQWAKPIVIVFNKFDNVEVTYNPIDPESWTPTSKQNIWEVTNLDNKPHSYLYIRGTDYDAHTQGPLIERTEHTSPEEGYLYMIGDITELLRHEGNVLDLTDRPYVFEGALQNLPNVVFDWLILPSTKVGEGCYKRMFYKSPISGQITIEMQECGPYACYEMFCGCEPMLIAPNELMKEYTKGILYPTKVGDYAYARMYADTGAETYTMMILPATELGEGAYFEMFSNSGDIHIGEDHWVYPNGILPATTLGEKCYEGMYSHTVIEKCPELPATVVNKRSYARMFEFCPNLTQGPNPEGHPEIDPCSLPATTLAEECYERMFYMAGRKLDDPTSDDFNFKTYIRLKMEGQFQQGLANCYKEMLCGTMTYGIIWYSDSKPSPEHCENWLQDTHMPEGYNAMLCCNHKDEWDTSGTDPISPRNDSSIPASWIIRERWN